MNSIFKLRFWAWSVRYAIRHRAWFIKYIIRHFPLGKSSRLATQEAWTLFYHFVNPTRFSVMGTRTRRGEQFLRAFGDALWSHIRDDMNENMAKDIQEAYRISENQVNVKLGDAT